MNQNIINGASSHVPAFLAKLWRIVDDPSTNDLICWSEAGNSFIIRNQAKFARELLPLYYKHNNMASFVRQLNMYGFHKVVSVEQGGLRVEKDEMEFAHPYFLQGNEISLELIKRKIPASKLEEAKSRPDNLNKVLLDVRQMKGRQESMDSKLHNMKRENEALWRELSALRQKHAKQQQIVAKLLQFLVSMMTSPNHRISFKRRMPLAINDADAEGKPSKLSRRENNNLNMNEDSNGPIIREIFEGDEQREPMVILSIPDEARNEDQRKALQEQFGDLLNVPQILEKPRSPKTTITVNNTGNQNQGSIPIVTHPPANTSGTAPGTVSFNGVASPAVSDLMSIHSIDSSGSSGSGSPPPNLETTQDLSTPYVGVNTTRDVVPMNTMTAGQEQLNRDEVQNRQFTKYSQGPHIQDDLDDHLDSMQAGLESLKDLLQGTQYNIDSSTLTGVGTSNSTSKKSAIFNPTAIQQLFELSPDHDIFGLVKENKEKEQGLEGNILGSEMVQYNPCLFELAEDDAHFFEDSPNAIMLDDELESMLTTDREKLNGGKIGK